MKVLVTGGAGYIGSHTVVSLLDAGHQPVIVDDFSNSSPRVLARLEKLTGQKLKHHRVDICDAAALSKVFQVEKPGVVIHFAAFKAVGESVEQPLRYYHNNVSGAITLCEVMARVGVKKLVFSSSCTVYGDPDSVPVSEEARLQTANPYGRTKLMNEEILRDLATTGQWQITLLRYFNPVGAHPSGLIGEDPTGIPNNLLPYVSQVAIGEQRELRVFGGDYETNDGTGIRDYLHVMDLAEGHVKAITHLPRPGNCEAYNLGTGRGYSVLEVVKMFEKVSGKPVPYRVVARRPGDIGEVYANPKKAQRELSWRAIRNLQDMCTDAWRWQSQNPRGY